jgi:predicted Zn-dependent protease
VTVDTHVIVTDPHLGRTACTYRGHLLGLPVVLAHELAHHHLGHHHDRAPDLYTAAALAVLGGAVVMLLIHPLLTLALAGVSAAAYLAGRGLYRAQEIAADLAAVKGLTAGGVDGRAMTLTVLAASPDPWWIRWGGWIASDHPTARARMRAVRSRGSC